PLTINIIPVPKLPFELLLDELTSKGLTTAAEAQQALNEIARRALDAERDHLLSSLAGLVETHQARLDQQLDERLETIETFKQGLRLNEEEAPRSAAEISAELSNLLHVPLKLDGAMQKL